MPIRLSFAGSTSWTTAPGAGAADAQRLLSGLGAGVSVAGGGAGISGGDGGAASAGWSDPLAAAQGVCGQAAQRRADRAGGDRGGAVARLVFVLRAGVAGPAGMALAGAVGAGRDARSSGGGAGLRSLRPAPSPDEKCYLCPGRFREPTGDVCAGTYPTARSAFATSHRATTGSPHSPVI